MSIIWGGKKAFENCSTVAVRRSKKTFILLK